MAVKKIHFFKTVVCSQLLTLKKAYSEKSRRNLIDSQINFVWEFQRLSSFSFYKISSVMMFPFHCIVVLLMKNAVMEMWFYFASFFTDAVEQDLQDWAPTFHCACASMIHYLLGSPLPVIKITAIIKTSYLLDILIWSYYPLTHFGCFLFRNDSWFAFIQCKRIPFVVHHRPVRSIEELEVFR